MMFNQPPDTYLGQINVAVARYDMDAPEMADFMARLESVNAVAEASPGFVWRLKDDTGAGATGVKLTDDPRLIVNMSLWRDAASLEAFVWKTVHAKVYNRKAEWFPHDPEPTLAFWWQPVSEPPDAQAAYRRLLDLRAHGPSETAFGWRDLAGATLWQDRRCA